MLRVRRGQGGHLDTRQRLGVNFVSSDVAIGIIVGGQMDQVWGDTWDILAPPMSVGGTATIRTPPFSWHDRQPGNLPGSGLTTSTGD